MKNVEETKSEWVVKKPTPVQSNPTPNHDPVTNVSLRKHVSGRLEELTKSQELAKLEEMKKTKSHTASTGTITTTKT